MRIRKRAEFRIRLAQSGQFLSVYSLFLLQQVQNPAAFSCSFRCQSVELRMVLGKECQAEEPGGACTRLSRAVSRVMSKL